MAPKSKYPCGGCNKDVTKQSRSIACSVCEFWFHYDCVEGMTDDFFENCNQAYQTWGYSAFFCKCCRKATTKLNKSVKELKEVIERLEKRLEAIEKDRDQVSRQVNEVAEKTEKVTADLKGMEKEVSNGMERAKEEAKKEMKTEMREQEERSENVVVYGLKEAAEGENSKEVDGTKFREMAKEVGVELEEGEMEVRFRAGKKKDEEGAKPRPLIVKIRNEEKRDRLRKNARLLARSDIWRTVFISEDLTWQQREEARKQERELREEADRKTEEARKEGKQGKFRVVGPRGRRKVVHVEE